MQEEARKELAKKAWKIEEYHRGIIMALDEITIQYYLGSNNVTMDTTLYHFNYLISLISGVFDSLALKTNDDLTINWNNNLDITLSNSRRKGIFLDQIREKNPDLLDHISIYGNFIKPIFSIRDVIIHREGLESIHYSYNNQIADGHPTLKGRVCFGPSADIRGS